AYLGETFNKMTSELSLQQHRLIAASKLIDERRLFTEAVLSGVPVAVVGIGPKGEITALNPSAEKLLPQSGDPAERIAGQSIATVLPEIESLLGEARSVQARLVQGQISLSRGGLDRLFNVSITSEPSERADKSYVVTLDDITDLVTAQRTAAWADVARRIAHEIKNPLTPIQLSAERLKRRFAREITSDPETFRQCADTIVRHVGDIGRMVDEFSRFARMPTPQIRPEDVGRVAREVFVLRRTARPDLVWEADIPESGPVAPCDGRLLREALTNLLQNAEDAVAAEPGAGHILLRVEQAPDAVRISATDDGVGLPEQDREKLTEPYVTHKPKGTGLGLAIVKKIMEDHGGEVTLDDRPDSRGAVAVLTLPLRMPNGA